MSHDYQQKKDNFIYIIDKKALLNEFPKKPFSDLLLVKKILLLAINKKSYEKYKKNPDSLIKILALLSLKEDDFNVENFNLEVIKRIEIIKAYFNVDNPSISKNAVYFKPNFKKIERLLENYIY